MRRGKHKPRTSLSYMSLREVIRTLWHGTVNCLRYALLNQYLHHHHFLGRGISKSLHILTAKSSSTSGCRGTVEVLLFLVLYQTVWFAPSRRKAQPCFCRWRWNTRSFIQRGLVLIRE